MNKTDDFTEKLRAAFIGEAQEQIQTIANQLIQLESTEDAARRKTIVEATFRELHNLKGSARAASFPVIEAICHPMEDIFADMKREHTKVSSDLLDALLTGVSLIEKVLKNGECDEPELNAVKAPLYKYMRAGAQASESLKALTILPQESTEATGDRLSGVPNSKIDSLRIPTARLDSLMQKAEEMLSVKAMARQNEFALNELLAFTEAWAKQLAKCGADIKAGRHSTLDVLEWNRERVQHLTASLKLSAKAARDYAHATSTSVDVLLDETKRLLMMPSASLFEPLPILVRQLSKELGKEVDVSLNGGDIELDKRILAQLKDPLTHLIRNCIDHGFETPEERTASGKPRRGRLIVSASQLDGSMVQVRIADDGKGIDENKVKQSAQRLGLLTAEECAKLSREEALGLIFKSSLSTSSIITEISGRGVGLAIVDENIRNLGGHIKVITEQGRGTTFVITLPITIATFRGVMVDVTSRTFVIPTTSIERVVRVNKCEIRPVEGVDTILLGDSIIPLCKMAEVLELPSSSPGGVESSELLTVSVLANGHQRIGFIVDEVLEEQEVLVKSLGPVLAAIENVSGVTVLGSGKIVPILNVSDLLRTSTRHRSRHVLAKPTPPPIKSAGQKPKSKRILVVDDTLTARLLLRNIFESAGFHVKAANDGLEALEALKHEQFDLLVTDIEMPRMNGFELTRNVRANAKLSDLPVVMVTSMTSREDRERGVAAGANAYFVKSSFDQSNLLEVVASLV